MEEQEDGRILALARQFQEQWEGVEPGIRRYIHHDELDAITQELMERVHHLGEGLA